MNKTARYDELVSLTHQRILNSSEIAELGQLATELERPNPLLPALAAVIAKVVIVNRDKKILVLWRSNKTPRPGQADLPGGGMGFGENPVDGVIREAKEEAGLALKEAQIVEAFGFIYEGKYALMLGYVGYVDSEDVRLSWEHERYDWMGIDEVLQLPDWQERHLKILTAAKARLALG